MDISRSKGRLALLILLWFGVAGGFLFWRSQEALVWCDTVLVANNLFEESQPLLWGNAGTLNWIVHNSFYDIGSDGYRPLSRIILWTGVALFSNPNFSPYLWFGAGGLVIGSTALSFLLVSSRFLRSGVSALFAVFLFLFSAPVVTGAWNMSCGFQAIVPLMICLGLLLYWKIVDSTQYKSWYVTGLCAVLFFGPWFREFIGLLPLLIIFLETQREKRPTILMGVSAIFFLHAIYPTALVKLLVYPDLPLRPVFAMGHLGVQSNVIVDKDPILFISQSLSDIRLAMPAHFVTLLPSTLFILAVIALLLPIIRAIAILVRNCLKGTVNEQIPKLTNLNQEFFLSFLFVLGIIVILLGFPREYWDSFGLFLLCGWLCFGLVLLALYRDGFLAWWFILFFIPFLKVFTEQVHLAYALLPASIIIAATVEDLWKSVQSRGLFYNAARYTLLLALAVAAADHSLNPYSSYRVVRSINNGIRTMADWFRAHVPQGSIVVANALHAEDIRLFSGGHIKVFWTLRAGIPRDEDAVAEPGILEKLLKENYTKRDVYFLDVGFNYTLDKLDYHTHKYVRNRSVDTEEIGLVHTTRVRYLFIDPLKKWVPRTYVSFLGAPDLENDFYRGPAQNGAPFMREVYAEYRIYKVTATEVDLWDPVGPVRMAKEGYKGFNILELNGRYFGIPQGEGPFSLQKVRSKEYSRSFVSEEYGAVIDQIDKALKNEN